MPWGWEACGVAQRWRIYTFSCFVALVKTGKVTKCQQRGIAVATFRNISRFFRSHNSKQKTKYKYFLFAQQKHTFSAYGLDQV